jgi:hypothetical protein
MNRLYQVLARVQGKVTIPNSLTRIKCTRKEESTYLDHFDLAVLQKETLADITGFKVNTIRLLQTNFN